MIRTVCAILRTIACRLKSSPRTHVCVSLHPLTCEHQGMHLVRTRFALKPKAPV